MAITPRCSLAVVFALGCGSNPNGTPSDGVGADGCTAAEKLIYVITVEGTLVSFDPATLMFHTVGPLSCPNLASPPPAAAMSVSRQGFAYVATATPDQKLWQVSTADASCQATSYQVPADRRIGGLGFARDNSSQGDSETLFVSTASQTTGQGLGLASLDLSTYALTPIGDFTNGLQGQTPQLTGTQTGLLLGLFGGDPLALAEIEKTTGATATSTPMSGLSGSDAYPRTLAFWGGDLWFFGSKLSAHDSVTHYHYSTDRSFSVAVDSSGLAIVAAGVSTCAPVVLE